MRLRFWYVESETTSLLVVSSLCFSLLVVMTMQPEHSQEMWRTWRTWRTTSLKDVFQCFLEWGTRAVFSRYETLLYAIYSQL